MAKQLPKLVEHTILKFPPRIVSMTAIGLVPASDPAPDPPPADPIGDALRAAALASYTMDEVNGTRVDLTGRGNNLAESSASVSSGAGVNGLAAQFAGNGQPWLTHASTTDLTLSGSRTICVWIKRTDNGYYLPLAKWNNGGNDREYLLELSSGSPTFYVRRVEDDNNVTVSHDPIELNIWHFFTIIYDAVNGLISLSTDRDTPSTAAISAARTSSVVFDVGNSTAFDAGLVGLIDDLNIFGKVLSDAELDYLFAGNVLFPAP